MQIIYITFGIFSWHWTVDTLLTGLNKHTSTSGQHLKSIYSGNISSHSKDVIWTTHSASINCGDILSLIKDICDTATEPKGMMHKRYVIVVQNGAMLLTAGAHYLFSHSWGGCPTNKLVKRTAVRPTWHTNCNKCQMSQELSRQVPVCHFLRNILAANHMWKANYGRFPYYLRSFHIYRFNAAAQTGWWMSKSNLVVEGQPFISWNVVGRARSIWCRASFTGAY